jgi:hypothetical protein
MLRSIAPLRMDALAAFAIMIPTAAAGSGYLQCGPGFGGSSLRQNLVTLVYLCEYFGLSEPAHYWNTVLEMNDYVKQRFTRNIVDTMHSSLNGKIIAVLGFAFKKNTSDAQESPAIEVPRASIHRAACGMASMTVRMFVRCSGLQGAARGTCGRMRLRPASVG